MTKTEFTKSAEDMLYLTVCVINGTIPAKERTEALDLSNLFEVCQEHMLTACVAYALEAAGIRNNDFVQAKEKSIRKNIILDSERSKILERLEAEHIWYMPLKGALLKDWYPKLGMRQMSDNDILFDSSFRADVKCIMSEMGFACDHYGVSNDDAYYKQPVSNFEMHIELFDDLIEPKLKEYYINVKDRLIKDDENKFGYHFTDEDFYIYITAHEYKHFSDGGTGVRTLADTYIFLRKFGESLDWDYISTELSKLEIADYEKQNHELAMKVFNGKALTDKERKLLDYYIFSGTYGNIENSFEKSMQKKAGGSKFRYVLQRIFPPMDIIRSWHPFFYRHKWLLPILWIYRPFHGLFKNRDKIRAELKLLAKK